MILINNSLLGLVFGRGPSVHNFLKLWNIASFEFGSTLEWQLDFSFSYLNSLALLFWEKTLVLFILKLAELAFLELILWLAVLFGVNSLVPFCRFLRNMISI